MTPSQALSQLEAAGGRLELLPDGRVEALLPPQPLPDEAALLAELRANRDEVAELLRRVILFKPDPGRAIPEAASTCPACHGTAFWISLAGVRVCERCHPPADERIVARRERAR